VFGFDSADRIVTKGQETWKLHGSKGIPTGATVVPSDPNRVYVAHR
jgi:hypothetical protein